MALNHFFTNLSLNQYRYLIQIIKTTLYLDRLRLVKHLGYSGGIWWLNYTGTCQEASTSDTGSSGLPRSFLESPRSHLLALVHQHFLTPLIKSWGSVIPQCAATTAMMQRVNNRRLSGCWVWSYSCDRWWITTSQWIIQRCCALHALCTVRRSTLSDDRWRWRVGTDLSDWSWEYKGRIPHISRLECSPNDSNGRTDPCSLPLSTDSRVHAEQQKCLPRTNRWT